MSNDQLDKRSCLHRAKEFLSDGNSIALRYAALELRMCMEAITYEKLQASAGHIPPSVLEKWQPPQAVKALLEYEPDTDKPFLLYAGIEKEYGVPSDDMKFVGAHRPFKLSWLRKNYNKLGRYLHFPRPNEPTTALSEAQEYLKSVVLEIDEVLAAGITGGFLAEVFEFQCQRCDEKIVCSKHRLVSSGHVECLNPNCGAEYFGELGEDGTSTFRLKTSTFECGSCGNPVIVENRHLGIGARFQCAQCGAKHVIVTRQWAYRVDEPES